MTDQRPTENDLEEPEQIRDDSGQRSDGRPTDPEDPGRSAWDSPEAVPTVAPEEKGGTPSTEHGPGGDL